MKERNSMKKEDLRIIFMGTPEFAVGTLEALIENKFNVVAVVTQPDKPVGRHGNSLQPSAVKQYAQAHCIPVLQPEKMKNETFIEELRSFRADIQVVVAFRMLPEVVWNMPRFGTFNVHASLLPQYRGAAPINRAIMRGETQTGVTTFFLDHEIDTGKMILQKSFDIPDEADVEYVYNGLMKLGALTAVETLNLVLEKGLELPTIAQPEVSPLYAAPKIFKDDCLICWNQSSKSIYDFVRGLSPYPGTWTYLCAKAHSEDGKDAKKTVLKVYKTKKTAEECCEECGTLRVKNNALQVATTDYWLEIAELQLTGKKRMKAKDFLNGFQHIEQFYVESKTESI